MFLVSSCSLFIQSFEARCLVENEDVVGAAPTDDAPTTSEWSTILLPTKMRLILKILRYSPSGISFCQAVTIRIVIGCRLTSRLPELQVSCGDLKWWVSGYQYSSSSNGHQAIYPFEWCWLWHKLQIRYPSHLIDATDRHLKSSPY